jgi:hypothetical protein
MMTNIKGYSTKRDPQTIHQKRQQELEVLDLL